jgi:hypothetical protein
LKTRERRLRPAKWTNDSAKTWFLGISTIFSRKLMFWLWNSEEISQVVQSSIQRLHNKKQHAWICNVPTPSSIVAWKFPTASSPCKCLVYQKIERNIFCEEHVLFSSIHACTYSEKLPFCTQYQTWIFLHENYASSCGVVQPWARKSNTERIEEWWDHPHLHDEHTYTHESCMETHADNRNGQERRHGLCHVVHAFSFKCISVYQKKQQE